MGSMKRMTISGLTVVLVGLLAAGWTVGTRAQDGTPVVGPENGLSQMGHPLVGSWIIFPNVANATPSLYTFAGDGTVVSSNVAGGRHGAWTATGDQTAAFTALGLATTEGDAFAGATRVRAEAEIDTTGNTLNVVFVIEAMTVDGIVQFTSGPFTAQGTRITVEPLGTEATPAAGTPEVGTPAVGDTTSVSATLIDRAGTEVGSALFSEVVENAGVNVSVTADGLTPGEHGIHVHETGVCDPGGDQPFASAGGHFNPAGTMHGGLGDPDAHAGDLGNVMADAIGRVFVSIPTDSFSLANLADADGSVLVIHANPDDLQTDPAGNSGEHVVCGVIFPPNAATTGTPGAATPEAGTPVGQVIATALATAFMEATPVL